MVAASGWEEIIGRAVVTALAGTYCPQDLPSSRWTRAMIRLRRCCSKPVRSRSRLASSHRCLIIGWIAMRMKKNQNKSVNDIAPFGRGYRGPNFHAPRGAPARENLWRSGVLMGAVRPFKRCVEPYSIRIIRGDLNTYPCHRGVKCTRDPLCHFTICFSCRIKQHTTRMRITMPEPIRKVWWIFSDT